MILNNLSPNLLNIGSNMRSNLIISLTPRDRSQFPLGAFKLWTIDFTVDIFNNNKNLRPLFSFLFNAKSRHSSTI